LKYISLLFILCFSLSAYGQLSILKKNNVRKAIVSTKDSIAYVTIYNSDATNINVSEKKIYTWYANHKIHSNLGAFSGYLLHGEYEAFDLDGNLITQGNFHNGTHDGKWLFFKENGIPKKQEIWDKGVLKEQVLFNSRGEIIKIRETKSEKNKQGTKKKKVSSTEKGEEKQGLLSQLFQRAKNKDHKSKDSVKKTSEKQKKKGTDIKNSTEKEEKFAKKLKQKLKFFKSGKKGEKKIEK
jgi:hypothetical protein